MNKSDKGQSHYRLIQWFLPIFSSIEYYLIQKQLLKRAISTYFFLAVQPTVQNSVSLFRVKSGESHFFIAQQYLSISSIPKNIYQFITDDTCLKTYFFASFVHISLFVRSNSNILWVDGAKQWYINMRIVLILCAIDISIWILFAQKTNRKKYLFAISKPK